MDFGAWLTWLPLWAVFLLTLAICIGAIEGGAALAHRSRVLKQSANPGAPLASVVGAMLGLLAFILAFTFGLTASRFDVRRQLVLQESNAIGTTYLRAGLLPPEPGLEIRRLLREYADVRLKIKFDNIPESLKEAEEVHGLLWTQTKLLVKAEMDPELRALFIKSLNELIDLHQSRKTVGLQYRIPGSVWFVVYLLMVLSMFATGYQGGLSGVRRMLGYPVLAAGFSLVVMMIADVDRPAEGFMRVSQQPIADVQQSMAQDSP